MDTGIGEGDSISPFYDPMIGKLIAWGENREEARQRLLAMLVETHIYGVRTNLAFLSRILAHPAFAATELDTDFIPRYEKDLFITPSELPAEFWSLARRAWALSQPERIRQDDPTSQWALASGWRSAQPQLYTLNLQAGEQQQGGLTASMNGNIVQILVKPGLEVEEGATLVVLEAMKMEHSIVAPHAGTVQNIFCAEGELVSDGMVLVELDGGE